MGVLVGDTWVVDGKLSVNVVTPASRDVQALRRKTTAKMLVRQRFCKLVVGDMFIPLPANGWRYPLVGGTRQRLFAGTNSKPRNMPKNAATPTRRVHAVLGSAIIYASTNNSMLTLGVVKVHVFLPMLFEFASYNS
jgi:hypothetical protein